MMHGGHTENQESSGEYQTYLRLYLPSATEQQQQQQVTQSMGGARQVVTSWRELPANPLMPVSYRHNTSYRTQHENVHFNANMHTNHMEQPPPPPPQPIPSEQHYHQNMSTPENNMQHNQGNDQFAYYNAAITTNSNNNNNYYNKDNNNYCPKNNHKWPQNNWENNYNCSYRHDNNHYNHNKQIHGADNAQMQYPLPLFQQPLPPWQHGQSSLPSRSRRDRRKDKNMDKYANKPFHCDACQKGFNTETEYEAHRATHLYCSSPGCHFTCRKDKPWKMEEHMMLLHNRPNAPDLLDSEKYLAQRRQRFPTHHTVESKVEELYYQAARGVALPGERRRWLRQHGIIVGKRPRVLGNARGNTLSIGKANTTYVVRGQPPSLTSTIAFNENHNVKGAEDVNYSNSSSEVHSTDANNIIEETTSNCTIANDKLEVVEIIEDKTDNKMQVDNNNITYKVNTPEENVTKVEPPSFEKNDKEESNAIHASKTNKVNLHSVSLNQSKKCNNDDVEEEDVPSYYVCHRCGRKGEHHVRHCPTRHDSTFDRHIVWGEAKLETSHARKRARGQQAKREATSITKDNCNSNINNNNGNNENDQTIDCTTTSVRDENNGTTTIDNNKRVGDESNKCMNEEQNDNIAIQKDKAGINEANNDVANTHITSNNSIMKIDLTNRHGEKKERSTDNKNINNVSNEKRSDDDDNNPPPSVSAKQINSVIGAHHSSVDNTVNVTSDVNVRNNLIDSKEQYYWQRCEEHELTYQSSLEELHKPSVQNMHERTRVLAPVAASRLANRHPQPHGRSNTHMHKSNRTRRSSQLYNTSTSSSASQLPSLYSRLTEEDHMNERGVLLQAIHYFVTNNFFC